MISLLAKWFIPRREQVADSAVRRAWGALCGFVGIALNLLLLFTNKQAERFGGVGLMGGIK